MPETMEKQIAKALTSGSSAEIERLIPKVEASADDARARADRERDRALDPLLDAGEAEAARKDSDAAQFAADRMARAVTGLREALERSREADRQGERRALYERAKAARDAAGGALAAKYQGLADALAELLEAAYEADQLVARANLQLPSDAPRLDTVEVVFRPGGGAGTKTLYSAQVEAWAAEPGTAPTWGRALSIGGGYERSRPQIQERAA